MVAAWPSGTSFDPSEELPPPPRRRLLRREEYEPESPDDGEFPGPPLFPPCNYRLDGPVVCIPGSPIPDVQVAEGLGWAAVVSDRGRQAASRKSRGSLNAKHTTETVVHLRGSGRGRRRRESPADAAAKARETPPRKPRETPRKLPWTCCMTKLKKPLSVTTLIASMLLLTRY